MRNLKVKISVKFDETEDSVTDDDSVERMDDGNFELVIDNENEFDIDRLENAALKTCYPALRDALSSHLENVSKKKPVSNQKLL